MKTVLPSGYVSWALGVVDSTHGTPTSILVMAAPNKADGTAPDPRDFTLRATMAPTDTKSYYSTFLPPLDPGPQNIRVDEINEWGVGASVVIPFIYSGFPPNPPTGIAVF